jgi:hypothetical protein
MIQIVPPTQRRGTMGPTNKENMPPELGIMPLELEKPQYKK